MAKKLITGLLLFACAFGLLACQSQQQTAPNPVETNKISAPPPNSVPFSKGPTGPPGVKGPSSPPPGSSMMEDTQAVTEKDNNTYTLPRNN